MEDWAADKKEVWHRICDKYGGNKEAFDWGTCFFFDWSVGRARPTLSSMTKARKYRRHRHDDSFEAWIETLKSFENAGMLPKNERLLAKSSSGKVVNGVAQVMAIDAAPPA